MRIFYMYSSYFSRIYLSKAIERKKKNKIQIPELAKFQSCLQGDKTLENYICTLSIMLSIVFAASGFADSFIKNTLNER